MIVTVITTHTWSLSTSFLFLMDLTSAATAKATAEAQPYASGTQQQWQKRLLLILKWTEAGNLFKLFLMLRQGNEFVQI